MEIRLKPELESMIRADVARGPYESVDEFVERAVELLHEQEEWLLQNREEVSAAIDKGFAQAEARDRLDPEDALAMLRARQATRDPRL